MNITVNEKWLKEREHMSDHQIVAHLKMLIREAPIDKKSLYQKFMDEYDAFIKNKIGVGANVNGQEGKALKAVINYITSQSKDKTEEGILNSFKYILENWNKLDNFTRSKMRLSDINSNLTNILNTLRNGRNTTATQTTIAEQADSIANWDGN